MDSTFGPSLLFTAHPDPVWIYDVETLAVHDVNDAALEAYGQTRADFCSSAARELSVESLRDVDLPSVLSRVVSRLRPQRRKGEPINVNVMAERFDLAGRPAMLVVERDVVQRVLQRDRAGAASSREAHTGQDAQVAARNFLALFEAMSGRYLVIKPDNFQIVAASDPYLEATATARGHLYGRSIFDIFPDEPGDPASDGARNLRASLQRVASIGQPDALPLQRYLIRSSGPGHFEERSWRFVNTPIKEPGGGVALIVSRVEDFADRELPMEPTREELAAVQQFEDERTRVGLDILLKSQELERAKERIREQEASLRVKRKLLKSGGWKLNMESGILTWSDEVYGLYGLQKGEFDNTFGGYVDLVFYPDREGMVANYDRFAASGELEFEFEHRVEIAGRLVRLRGLGELTITAEGRVLTGVVQDITALTERDIQLTQANALLGLAGRAAELGGWRFELNPERLTWTPQVARIHGEPDGFTPTVEQALGYYHPGYREEIASALNECIEQGTPFDEVMPLRTATGEDIWVRAIGEAEYNAEREIVAVQGAFQNVSELVQAQAIVAESERVQRSLAVALAEETERLNIAQSVAGVGSWETDLGSYRVTWSPALYDIFGIQPDEFDGTHTGFMDRVHLDDRKAVNEAFSRSLDSGEDVHTIDHRIVTGSGATKVVSERWKVIRDAEGEPERVTGTTHDISERVQLESMLRQSQKLEAIGQLTGGVAHDFNNVLTIILANAELLSEELSDKQQLRMMADMTATAAERGAELTRQLLAFARRQPLEPKIVDIGRLVGSMDALLRRTIPEDVSIEIIKAGGLWMAEIDPAQLESALINLVVNASHAMPEGGCLTIETANVMLDDSYAASHSEVDPGQYVMVSVSDSGMGMAPSVLDKAFEPFFTTKEVGKGTGLGLSMVYGFAKQSKGHAKIYSEVGHGTTVKLYFPRAIAAFRLDGVVERDFTVVGGTEHILVVEDDEMVRNNLANQLMVLGYRVTQARSGLEALEKLGAISDIDLLFTDVVMPGGMNGRQLAEQARRLLPNLKVLFTSGYTENAIVHNGRLDAGAHLLSKPYRRQAMAAKVRTVLDGIPTRR